MPTAPTKLQRWLDLVAYLAGRRFPVSTAQLWEAVPAYQEGLEGDARRKAAVRRTFERDKDELRALGIPIETVTFQVQGEEESHGYRIQRDDFHLPYLRLVEEARGDGPRQGRARPAPPDAFSLRREEAAAALSGLRELSSLPAFPLAREARSAFRKLAFDLDTELAGDAPVVHVEDPEAAATAPLLRPLSDALLARKTVSFDYHAMHRDARARRTVHPYGLVFQHGRWYLVARDPSRDGVRMFRVGRMGDVEVNSSRPGTPDYEIPEDFQLAEYGGRKAWELGDEDGEALEATVLFRFPRSFWAERNGHGRLVEEREDGSQLRRFTLHRTDPFLRWVLSLGGDAAVLEPPELRSEFAGMLRQVAQRHEDTDG